jgi:hypothetical protein
MQSPHSVEDDDELLPDTVDLNFAKESLEKIYRMTRLHGIHPERWDRVRRDIRFDDVVSELTGNHNVSKIRCPFHGRDSTPSFTLYRRTNDGWCFGCPPGEQYYDAITLTSRLSDISRPAALEWLEKHWELPTFEEPLEAEEVDVVIEVDYSDLVEPYILKATAALKESADTELALDYMHIFFDAWNLAASAEKLLKNPVDSEEEREESVEEATKLKVKATTKLARVLGQTVIDRILREKDLRT